MFHSKKMQVIAISALFFMCTLNAWAQRVRGELRLEVHDPHGTPVPSPGELVSESNGFRRTFVAGSEGRYVAQDLPFGVYRLSLQAEGFAPWSDLVEIRSELPVRMDVTLGVAPLTTRVEVNDSATLVDPYSRRSKSMTQRNRGASCWTWCPNSRDGCMKPTACFIREVRNTTCSSWWTDCR